MSNLLTHFSPIRAIVLTTSILSMAGCFKAEGNQPVAEHHSAHKILVTSPVAKDVERPQPYVCQIHSRRHIEVRALEGGYLEEIMVKEGQFMKKDEVMFKIYPVLFKAKVAAAKAEVDLAQIDFTNTDKLFQQKVVAQPEVALAKAKLEKAEAQMKLAEAELSFTTVKAPFDGIIDHQHHQQGSLIAEGDVLTTLSDNEVMWAYFNVPEADYLAYQASNDKEKLKIELMLANGEKFSEIGTIGAIEADFNNETGNIAFRADFHNPQRLLRNGQTGTVLISKEYKDAIVIPQRAKFDILAKNYVFVVTKETPEEAAAAKAAEHGKPGEHAPPAPPPAPAEHAKPAEHPAPSEPPKPGEPPTASEHEEPKGEYGIVRQREVEILLEMEDVYLIKSGLKPDDRFILEGIRQVRDGDKVEYEYMAPEEALSHLKYHAE